MSSSEFCIVLTTTNEETDTKTIIQTLLSKQLAACIQTMPINSHYVWKEKVCVDNETLLIIKTKRSLYDQVEQAIFDMHNYEVPQIVQLSIDNGLNPYLAWLDSTTTSK